MDKNLDPRTDSFSKELKPVNLKTSNPRITPDANIVAPTTNETYQDDFFSALSEGRQDTTNNFTEVNATDVDTSGRYPLFYAGQDNEEMYAQGQSAGSQMVNGIGKGLSLAATTFLQTTVGTVNGLVQWADTGKFSSFYDNEMNRTMDDFNKDLENQWANYYTKEQSEAAWYSPDKLFTANFLWDGIVKNMGFAVGAMASGGVYSAGLKGISAATKMLLKTMPKTARMLSSGKGLDAFKISNQAMQGTGKAGKMYKDLVAVSSRATSGYNALNKGQRAIVAGLSTSGEAGFEAMHNLNDFRDKEIRKFKSKNNGREPNAKEYKLINELAEDAGNMSFALNAGLLSVTNFIQFPRLLGASYSGEKSFLTGLKRTNPLSTNKIVKEVGKVGASQKWNIPKAKTKIDKMLSAMNKTRPYLFSISEGFEEGGQFAISKGVEDYYSKRDSQDPQSVIDSVIFGLKETLTSDEGLESILIGGLSGAIMTGRGTYKRNNKKEENTEDFVKRINDPKYQMSAFTEHTFESINRGMTLQEEINDAYEDNDINKAKNLGADYMINYLIPRVMYGRGDLVKADVEDYTKLASTEEGFAQLVEEGKTFNNEDRLAYIERINKVGETAKDMESLYDTLTLKYGSLQNAKGDLLYPPEILEKLIYSATKISDYNRRINKLSRKIPGIDLQSVLDEVMQGLDGEYERAKTDLKSTLKNEELADALVSLEDISKMAMYKQMHVSEFDNIKETPGKHVNPKNPNNPDDEEVEIEDSLASVIIKVDNRDFEEGQEYFVGNLANISEDGTVSKQPSTITLLGENTDGTLQIEDENGVRTISVQEFKDLNLGTMPSLKEDKKAKFFLDTNENSFEFNFGSRGGKLNGKLKYNSPTGELSFVYLKEGKLKTIEVFAHQFKSKGKANPLIQSVERLNRKQKKSLKEFLNKKDERATRKDDKRVEILNSLIEDLKDKSIKIKKKINSSVKSITLREKDIAKLKEDLKNDGYKKSAKTPVLKKVGKELLKTIATLNIIRKNSINELEALEQNLSEIELAKSQTNDLIESLDVYNTDTSEFVKELKDEIKNLNVLVDETKKQDSILKSLIKSAEDFIEFAQKEIGKIVTKFENKYPDAPALLSDKWGVFLQNNPDYLKANSDIESDVFLMNEAFDAVVESEINPKSVKLDELSVKLKENLAKLKEYETSVDNKNAIISLFVGVTSQYQKKENEKEALKRKGILQNELINTHDSQVDTTNANEGDFEGARKTNFNVVGSGVVPSEIFSGSLSEYVVRGQILANKFLKIHEKKGLRGVLMTQKSSTINGLMDYLYPTGSPLKKSKMIVLVVTNTAGIPVNKDGDAITDSANYLKEGIFQVFPTTELDAGSGKKGSMFIPAEDKTEADEQLRLMKEYALWHADTLSKETPGTPQKLISSFGIKEYDTYNVEEINSNGETETIAKPDYRARNSIKDTNLIETDDDLTTSRMLRVATTNAVMINGNSKINTPLGSVALFVPGGIVKMFNKKHSKEQAKTIYDIILQLSKNVERDGTTKTLGTDASSKTESTENLINALKSITYWGRNENKPGHSNIWYQVSSVDGMIKLYMGKESKEFDFTPTALETKKDFILEELSFMYGNTQNKLLSETSYNESYDEPLSVNENGFLIEREWPNYQSYLLSSTFPVKNNSELLGGQLRDSDSIPLTTNMKSLKGQDEDVVNKIGIYFTLSNTPESFDPAKPRKKIIKTKPDGSTDVSVNYNLNGTVINEMPLGQNGKSSFSLNLKEAAKALNKSGLMILEDAQKLRNFIKVLKKKGLFNADIPDATVDLFIAHKKAINKDSALEVAEVLIIKTLKDRLTTEVIKIQTQDLKDKKEKEIKEAKTTKEFNVDGKEQNVVTVGNLGVLNFTIIGTKLKEVLKADPYALEKTDTETKEESNKKINGFLIDALNSGDLVLDISKDLYTVLLSSFKLEDNDEGADVVNLTLAKFAVSKVSVQVEEEIVEEKRKEDEIADENDIEENSDFDDLEFDEEDDSPFRTQKDSKVYEEENWDKIIPWIKKTFPSVSVNRLKNIIKASNGRQAFGLFQNAAIYVQKNAEAGTAYHEVFHAIWRMALTIEEQSEIYREFRKQKGTYIDKQTGKEITFSEASNLEIEEDLAEQFRIHTLFKEDNSFTGILKKIVKAIFNQLTKIFNYFAGNSNSVSNVDQLFEKIGNGYFKDFNQYESKLSLASSGVIDIDNVVPNNSAAFRLTNVSPIQEHELYQHMTWVYSEYSKSVKSSVYSATEALSATDTYEVIKGTILGVPRKKRGIILDKVERLKRRLPKEPENKDVIVKEILGLQKLRKDIKKEWPTIAEKHKASLVKYDVNFNEEEETLEETSNTGKEGNINAMKIDTFKKAPSVIKLLFAALPDAATELPNSKHKRTSIGGVSLVNSGKIFNSLMHSVQASTNIDRMLLKLESLAEFDINYKKIYKDLTKVDSNSGDDINYDNLTGEEQMLIVAFWNTFKKQNPDTSTVFILPEGGTVIGNTALSSAARTSKYLITNDIVTSIKNGNKYFTENSNGTFSSTALLENLTLTDQQSYLDFLSELGIDFKSFNTLNQNQKDVFFVAVNGLKTSLKEMKKIQVLNNKTLGSNKSLLRIGLTKATIENPSFKSTYYTMNNESSQANIGPNSLSNLHDFITESETFGELANTPYSYLSTDVFSQDSNVINNIYHPVTGKKRENSESLLKPVIIDGTINDQEDKKVQSSYLNLKERIQQQVNLNLDGVYYPLVPGDSSLEHATKLHHSETPFVSTKDVQKRRDLDKIKNYFFSEYKLAKSKRVVSAKRKSEDLRFFKDIFDFSNKSLHEMLLRKEYEELNEEQFWNLFGYDINQAVNKFVEADMADNNREFQQYGLISSNNKEGEGYQTSLGFESVNSEVLKDGTVVNTITEVAYKIELRKLSLNYMMATIEFHKILFSDPYQYKDELKRIKNFLSPRQVLLSNSAKITAALNKKYNEDYPKGSLGHTDMTNEYFRTITLQDVFSSADLDGYRESNESYEETDGGGMITLKAHRIFRIRTSSWSPANEAQYKHDIGFQELVEKKGTDEEIIEYEKNNPGIKNTYTPNKPIVSGNKANGRNYNDVVLDKYALLPLSFRLLYLMNKDSNALKFYKKLENENIDYAIYNSGRKVGAETLVSLYKDGKFNEDSIQTEDELNDIVDLTKHVTITNIPFNIISLQTEVPSKDSNEVTQGSQITKLISLDFLEGGVPIDFILLDGKEEITNFDDRFAEWIMKSENEKRTLSPLYNGIIYNQELLEERIESGFNNLLKKLGLKKVKDVNNYSIDQRNKLINTLESEILKKDVNDNLLDAFESFRGLNSDISDTVLEATPVYQQLRNILYSIANSNVVRPKIRGGLKVQIPSTLFEQGVREVSTNGGGALVSDNLKFYTRTVKKTKDGEVVFDKDGDPVTETVNVMQIMAGRWFKSKMNDADLLKHLNTTKEGQALLKGVAFRTPTQKQNSIEIFEIKQFLPAEMGDSVVLPSAIVKKTGSDYDIDKLSVYLKNVLFKQGLPIPVKFLTEENSKLEERYVKYINEKADQESKEHIVLLSQEKITALDEKFSKEKGLDYTNFIEDLNEERESEYDKFKALNTNVISEHLLLLKEVRTKLHFEGKNIFNRLNSDLKSEYKSAELKFKSEELIGVSKIRAYIALTLGFLNDETNDNNINLKLLLKNYEDELTLLGESKENINEFIAASLDSFRNKKKYSHEDLLSEFQDTKSDLYKWIGERKNELDLDLAKQVAKIENLPTIEQFSALSILKQNTDQAIENEYIESLEFLIAHPTNFKHLVKPNSAEILKDIAKDINKKLGKNKIDFRSPGFMLKRSNMNALRHAFITGKQAIGIAAIAQTNHAQNQRSLIYLDPNREIPAEDNFWLGINDTSTGNDDLLDIDLKFENYNSVIIKNKRRTTLSKSINAEGEYISDIIGMFIDGYVDISDGPWIMEMGATPDTAGTWLFLVKAGVPIQEIAYFMNQPIIKEYLKDAEVSGKPWLFNKKTYDEKLKKWGKVSEETKLPSSSELGDMVGKTISGQNALSSDQRKQQSYILKEFLKYSKLAEHLFFVTQGTNMDTAKLNDEFLIFKKQEQLKTAVKTVFASIKVKEDKTIESISGAESLLNNSFVGVLNNTLMQVREAFTSIFIADRGRLRPVVEKTLLPYIKKSDREFVRISQKVVESMFDWAVQIDTGVNKKLASILLGSSSAKSAAKEIIDFKDSIFGKQNKDIAPNIDHPLYGNPFLESITLLSGDAIEKKSENLQIVGRENTVFDQNILINSFKEIKEYLGNTKNSQLYGKIVRLAVLQSGLSTSPISFTKLLPYNDFKAVYNKTLSNLENMNNLETFNSLHIFHRNNWSDNKIVPVFKKQLTTDNSGKMINPESDNLDNALKDAMNNNLIPNTIFISEGNPKALDVITYNYSVWIDSAERERRKKSGNTDHFKSVLMKKVYMDKNRNFPLLQYSGEKVGFVYTAINAWGDSFKAKEFYDWVVETTDVTVGRKAPVGVFNNGKEKIVKQFSYTGKLSSAGEVSDGVIYNTMMGRKIINPIGENNIDIKDPTIVTTPGEVYSKLGNKTKSKNVVIKSIFQLKGKEYAESINGIFSMRVSKIKLNYGNIFSSVDAEVKKGSIRTATTKESVEKYIDFVVNSTDERAVWMRNQIKSGQLKNTPIVYYKELNEPSHATALDYLINKYDWKSKLTAAYNKPTVDKTMGGFDHKGKGTAKGDGKDIAMREIATASIVEFKSDKRSSSSFTSLDVGNENDYGYDSKRFVGASYVGSIPAKNNFGVVNNYGPVTMLARNSALGTVDLAFETKTLIKKAHEQGTRFVVGDMPNVDSVFVDYLRTINADFTIYHTGTKNRLNVLQSTFRELNLDSVTLKNDILTIDNIDYLYEDATKKVFLENGYTEDQADSLIEKICKL